MAAKTNIELELLNEKFPTPEELEEQDRFMRSLTLSKFERRWLFFSCVIYSRAECRRFYSLRKYPRYRRILFVLLFDWLKPDLRARLGIR